jgi:hypothetical protein
MQKEFLIICSVSHDHDRESMNLPLNRASDLQYEEQNT